MVSNRLSCFDEDLFDRSNRVIAQGALTNSKRRSVFVEGVYPTHLVRGEGCHVWDSRGNKYIDFVCGLGTNLL
jgi:glutamate-1-semialdehyde aminotransferase